MWVLNNKGLVEGSVTWERCGRVGPFEVDPYGASASGKGSTEESEGRCLFVGETLL
jgi:hypothetical protein